MRTDEAQGGLADSFITSPNWPVRVRRLLPFMAVASMNSRSPPTGVQARPMATPGVVRRALASEVKRTGPRYSAHIVGTDGGLFDASFGHFGGYAAADCGDFALQVAQPGLAGITADDLADSGGGEFDLAGLQPVFLALARHQVALGDVDLFVFGIAQQLNDFHAVAQPTGMVSRTLAVQMNITLDRSKGTSR
jgi:hypothetical protein